MSDNEKPNDGDNNALQEITKTVAITPEDCNGAADFWTHFEVPMPPELKEAFAKFAKDPSYENQNEVKLQVCKAIGYTEHEAFHDEMFKEIREECKNVTYDMGFDSALESVLTPEDDKE
jgi:hypothetical protein